MIYVGIVGGGHGGTAVLKAICGIPEVKVVGITDINPEAPGLQLARRSGIPVAADLQGLLEAPQLNVLIDCT